MSSDIMFATSSVLMFAISTISGTIATKSSAENFAISYRQGDLSQFMALFAPDARTNDTETIQNIRNDYGSLFANTEDRSIDITSMQWQRVGDVSRGEGNYVVKVRPRGKSENDVYRGKLWFTIRRYDGQLLISYFAFK